MKKVVQFQKLAFMMCLALLMLWSPSIKAQNGGGTPTVEYNQNDVNALKKLASDNPQCQELKNFVTNEGWKNQDLWQDWNNKIAVLWNQWNGRITGLRVKELSTVSTLDVTGLDSLVQLTCNNLRLRTLDLSKNPKLEILDVSWNGLETLDISHCPKIFQVRCYGNHDEENKGGATLKNFIFTGCKSLTHVAISEALFTSLDFSEISALQTLEIFRNGELSSLTLGNLSNLQRLNIGGCRKLTMQLDLSQATLLESLNVSYTSVTLNLGEAKNLRTLDLMGTKQFQELAVNPPTSLTGLFVNNTDYPLLDFSTYPNIVSYGVPKGTQELHLENTNIQSLNLEGANLLSYSKVFLPTGFTPKDQWSIQGRSVIKFANQKEEWSCNFLAGDTLDLSAYVTTDKNGNKSKFEWQSNKNGEPVTLTEIREGVFVLPKEINQFAYKCRISHPYYTDWVYETPRIHLVAGKNQKDIDCLKALAQANPNCKELQNFVAAKGWEQDLWNDWEKNKVAVSWAYDGRVSQLRIIGTNTVNTLNLAVLDSLEELHLVGSSELTDLTLGKASKLGFINLNDCPKLPSLDVTQAHSLRRLNVDGSDLLTFSNVKLPQGFQQVHGTIFIKRGEQLNNHECKLIAGATLDLSEYVSDSFGRKNSFEWKDNYGNPAQKLIKEIKPGVFVMPSQIDEHRTYQCSIKNPNYPVWTIMTQDIHLVRGKIEYSQDDINVLKALAKANPNCKELQEFVADSVKGWTLPWKNNYWEDHRKVSVDWNMETPARISKLRLKDLRLTNLDVKQFPKLEYLDVSDNRFTSLDLSTNTKLREIDASGNELEALDFSACPEIWKINCSWNQMKTLNITGCKKLYELSLILTALSSLDLTDYPSLQRLNIANCKFPVTLGDAVKLQYLNVNDTEVYGDLIKKESGSLTELFCERTNYPLISFTDFPMLRFYGIPDHVKELDISTTNIKRIYVGHSQLRYSTFTPATEMWGIDGENTYPLKGAVKDTVHNYIRPLSVNKGDTIDLSSEAMIDGIVSNYVWVDTKNRVEADKAFFTPVEGQLGKFIFNGKAGGQYFCIITNKKYCERSEINNWNGWRLRTSDLIGSYSYDSAEISAVDKIVNDLNDPKLLEWWQSGAWKTQGGDYNDNSYGFRMFWRTNKVTGTKNLQQLSVGNWAWPHVDSLKQVDLSAFSQMESIELRNFIDLVNLTLPTEKVNLKRLICSSAKLSTIDVAGYTNLVYLDLRYNPITALDVSRLSKLEELYCNGLDIEIPMQKLPKGLKYYGVPRKTTAFDMNALDSLKALDPSGSSLRFSTVTLKKGQPWDGRYHPRTVIHLEGVRNANVWRHLITDKTAIDLSSEMKVNNVASQIEWSAMDRQTNKEKPLKVENKNGVYYISGLRPNDRVEAFISNSTYQNWEMRFSGMVYSCDGDANLDFKVDVLDISATANYILGDEIHALPGNDFGYYEANVNMDENLDVADITGIANIIMGKPLSKNSQLRGAFVPMVTLTTENGMLYMETEVPVNGLQLEFEGIHQAEPLMGKAAGFTQASFDGETFRILAYSMKGETISAGKHALMKWPAGATLKSAAFSDPQARSLDVDKRAALPTSVETINVEGLSKDVYNYPNPFHGSTTLVYQLSENVDKVTMEVYNYGGTIVDVVSGLNTQMGTNEFTYSTSLSNGTYIYRLVTEKQGVKTYSKSNTFIIK